MKIIKMYPEGLPEISGKFEPLAPEDAKRLNAAYRISPKYMKQRLLFRETADAYLNAGPPAFLDGRTV